MVATVSRREGDALVPPLYREIAASLRAQITGGTLRPGDKLPSETQLMDQFDASKHTIRAAIAQLANEGLVAAVGGRGRSSGVFVRSRLRLTFHASYAEDPGSARSESDSWHGEVQAAGLTPSQRFECRMVRLDPEYAELLGEPEGSAAVLRRCVRSVNGNPSSIQDSYYPMWLAEVVPQLLSPDDIAEGTTRLLARRGFEQVGYLDTVTARMPSEEEVSLLELPPGTPVLVKLRAACTVEHTVRVTVETMAGDSNALEYEIGDVTRLRARAEEP